MNLYEGFQTWCHIASDNAIVIVTDSLRHTDAGLLAAEFTAHTVRVILADIDPQYWEQIHALKASDLVIAFFSLDGFIQKKLNRVFSPFRKPEGLAAKYAFIRLDIALESLRQGLSTPREWVYDMIEARHSLPEDCTLRVTNAAGTDLTLSIEPFITCEHEIILDGDMAFLPPSETSSVVKEGSAEGCVVIDITVGQLYYYGDLLGYFGLVDQPVTLHIHEGYVRDITGGAMAAELKEKLFALPVTTRKVVELGQGLSQMLPTGLIGVDESIISTCHFGIGDAGESGVHLDVVIKEPMIAVVP